MSKLISFELISLEKYKKITTEENKLYFVEEEGNQNFSLMFNGKELHNQTEELGSKVRNVPIKVLNLSIPQNEDVIPELVMTKELFDKLAFLKVRIDNEWETIVSGGDIREHSGFSYDPSTQVFKLDRDRFKLDFKINTNEIYADYFNVEHTQISFGIYTFEFNQDSITYLTDDNRFVEIDLKDFFTKDESNNLYFKKEFLINNLVAGEGLTIKSEDIPHDSTTVKAAIQSLEFNKASDQDLTDHKNNNNNPHLVTKFQLGLGNVENKNSETIRSEIVEGDVPQLPQSRINNLVSDLANKVEKNSYLSHYGTPYTKITFDKKGLVTNGGTLVKGDIPNIDISQVNNLNTELGDKVDKEINGRLITLTEVNKLDTLYALLNNQDQGFVDTLSELLFAFENFPEGLNLIDLLGSKVNKNNPINAGTHPKITFDSKGLVTSGSALVKTDIPNIDISQVINLLTELNNKVPVGRSINNKGLNQDQVLYTEDLETSDTAREDIRERNLDSLLEQLFDYKADKDYSYSKLELHELLRGLINYYEIIDGGDFYNVSEESNDGGSFINNTFDGLINGGTFEEGMYRPIIEALINKIEILELKAMSDIDGGTFV